MKMGSSFKKAIFEERVQVGLLDWAGKVKRKKGLKAAVDASGSGSSGSGAGPGNGQAASNNGSTLGIQLGRLVHKSSAEEIQPATGTGGSK